MKAKDLMQILQEFRDSKSLKGKNLVKCNLKKAGFDQGKLSEIDFSEAKLVRSKFTSSQINQSQFVKAALSRSDFSQVKGVECDFTKADIAIAKFEKARFENSTFNAVAAEFVEMPEAEFIKTSFAGGVIKVSKLGKTVFKDCGFVKTDMSDSFCEEATFSGCDMRESVMLDIKANKSVFTDVNFSQADLSYSDFVGAKFVNCDFSEACVKYIDVTDAVFENCKFKGANFKGAIALDKKIEEEIVAQGGRVSKKVIAKFIKSVFASIGHAFCWVFVSLWKLIAGFCFGITGFLAKLFGIPASQKEKAWIYSLSYVIVASFIISVTLFFLACAYAVASFACKGNMCQLFTKPLVVAEQSAPQAERNSGEQQVMPPEGGAPVVEEPPETVQEILKGFEGFLGFQQPPAVFENMVNMDGCFLQDRELIAIGQKEDESLKDAEQAPQEATESEQEVDVEQAQGVLAAEAVTGITVDEQAVDEEKKN